MRKLTLRHIKTPRALAALGAFFVPEPLGACLVLAAAAWWLCRKPFWRTHATRLPETLGTDPRTEGYAPAAVISTDAPLQ